ncbi:glycosyltransferase family 2 protein [Phyllobacterium lublinensis]|uniref:glycosyltransferase family 2 protein n=1 Tax=Phyllobacterium lublinensis TaxID=2875708 RepID=UPI001CC9BFCB|nr:glycosyltransferase family A protein [Phyllobacterium sp. 2063]MBZ9656089.1 glycosyltransferase family 2 protein [Phyllobacterium sp. 2063]
MSSRIAVVYLARLHEGFHSFEAFAETYRRHPAGEDHDLYIVCKGFEKPGEYAAIGAVFTGIKHKIIHVKDDIGLDIHAYQEAARKIDNEYICCLNTFTSLRTDNWLAKLWANMSKPGVGLVGATGSFESLYNSWKVVNFVSWSTAVPARYDRAFVRNYAWLINQCAPHMLRAAKSKQLRIRRFLSDTLRNRPSNESLQEEYSGVWAQTLSQNGGFCSNFRDFPRFPNPHIRSTAFLVRRKDLLAVTLEDKGKIACCKFESGTEGLSISMMRQGLELLVVGADGVGYSMEQWPTCGAFRSGNQSNLLASDNQTDSYNGYSAEEKLAHRIMSWGGYDPDIDDNAEIFRTPFHREFSITERIEHFRDMPKAKKERLFSIAIPTHNRLDLVLDAIKTVTNQNYSNWEIVVFDNCSKEPVGEAIRAIGDPRIRCERSDEFLPVTGSWNRAINMARGDFITMVGDDDGIAPGYFERMNYLIDHFDNPELIFTNLYQFMHPGVVPGHRPGYVADLQMADFLVGRDAPFVVDPKVVRTSVDNSLKMRRSFMFNMPAFCCSRALLDRIRVDGEVLHSPFPDYYFANLVLESAIKVVAEPKPLAFQGVSKVSFGFTMINAKIDDGFKVLNHDVANDRIYGEVAKHILPGNRYNSEYIVTMAYLASALGDKSRQPDFKHYRKVQIWQYVKSHHSMFNWLRRDQRGKEIWSQLSTDEKLWMLKVNILHKLSLLLPRYFGPMVGRIDRESSAYLYNAKQVFLRAGDHVTLMDVFKDLENGPFSQPIERADAEKKPAKKKASTTRGRKTMPVELVVEETSSSRELKKAS